MHRSALSRTLRKVGAVRPTVIDAKRTWWLDSFFSTWRFASPEAMFEAVSHTSVDPPTLEAGRDLHDQALSGWGYWFLFVKGWLQYRRAQEVGSENTYLRYMTEVFDADRHDPGIAEVLRDPSLARERVALRFRDMDELAATDPFLIPSREDLGDVRVWLRDPPPPGSKLLYEAGTGHQIGPAMVDGHHRLFAARLFGIRGLPGEVIPADNSTVYLDLDGRLGQVLRFTVPHVATVAVAAGPEGVRPNVHARRSAPFPPIGFEGATGEQLTAHLEHGRDHDGWQYLLVPAPALPWFRGEPVFRTDLEERYRVVVDAPDLCVLYVLWSSAGQEAAEASAFAEPPPPVEMRMLSSGVERAEQFVSGGRAAVDWIDSLLEDEGVELSSMERVLDFGCGAGRILRHLRGRLRNVAGADINPYLMAWVRGSLPSVETCTSSRFPPLECESESFDLILAIDVFSHFDERLHAAWIRELTRVAKPGGLIVLTFHGSSRADELPPDLRQRFDSGRLAVRLPELAGSIACAAYAPADYVGGGFTDGLEVVTHQPGGASDVNQDALLLRRPL